jgi:predicted amidohydrolase YtcJ
MKLDAIFHNGRIRTMDPDRPFAKRLGVIGGRVVGLDSELDGVTAHRMVDLGGAFVVPGFNDAHHHLSLRGQRLRSLDLRYGRISSLTELYETIRTFAAALPAEAWIHGSGYDQNKIGGHPSALDLDRVSGGRPLFLEHVSGHMGVGNTAAFERAGFAGRLNVPDVSGGFVRRLDDGAADGLLQERAMNLVTNAFRPLDVEEIVLNIAEASRVGLSEGLTSATEPGIGTTAGIGSSPLDVHAFQLARESGALGIRMTLMPYITALHGIDCEGGKSLGRGLDLGLRSGFGDEWLRIGPVKVLTDGSLIGRSAAMHHCYHGEDDNKGFMQFDPSELEDLLIGAHGNGWQLALHAIGDAAVDHALDLFDKAQLRFPRKDPRFRIEHFAVASDEQITNAARLGVIAVPQGRFISELGDGMMAALGPERSARLYRMKSLLDAGMVVPGSTDSPVVDGSPLKNIHDMVNRRTASGQLLAPNECLTVEQALYASTIGSAYAVHEDQVKGSLSRGKLADFVLLSDDLLGVAPEKIAELTVGATVVGGEIAYNDGAIAEGNL